MHSSRITDIFIWVYFFYVQPYMVEGLGWGFFWGFFNVPPICFWRHQQDINHTSIYIIYMLWMNCHLGWSQKFQGIILRFRVIFSENLKSKLWYNNLKVWFTDVEKYIFFCLVWFSVAETSFHVFVSVLAILAKDNKVIRRTHRTLF